MSGGFASVMGVETMCWAVFEVLCEHFGMSGTWKDCAVDGYVPQS